MTIVCVFTPKIVALRSTPTITIDLPWWLVLQKGWAVAWISWLDRGRSGGATALRRLDVQQLALIGALRLQLWRGSLFRGMQGLAARLDAQGSEALQREGPCSIGPVGRR